MAVGAPRPVVVVDWGTSSFRLWSLSAQRDVLQQTSGPFGMAGLLRDDFEGVLERQLAELAIENDVPVVICGMAGAAQGWLEVPYRPSELPLHSLGDGALRVPGVQRQITILPGVMQPDPADVMRGEETQLLGLLHARPDFSGSVCLPGTHSKWARLAQGRIEHFATCMTGELFSLLCDRSVLRHSTGENGWDPAAFDEAVSDVLCSPVRIATQLFGIRAASLLTGRSAAAARSRLSGLLIGLELAATRILFGSGPVVLIGTPLLAEPYSRALALQSVDCDVLDADELTRRGLVAAFDRLEDSSAWPVS